MTTTDRARKMAEHWQWEFHRQNAITVIDEIAALLDLLVEARKWLDRLDGMRDRPRYADELEIVPLIEKIDKIVEGR